MSRVILKLECWWICYCINTQWKMYVIKIYLGCPNIITRKPFTKFNSIQHTVGDDNLMCVLLLLQKDMAGRFSFLYPASVNGNQVVARHAPAIRLFRASALDLRLIDNETGRNETTGNHAG